MDEEGETEPFEMMDNIPFSFVGMQMYYKIADRLDPDSAVSGNNWRMLAEKLGNSTQEIIVMESMNGRNTLKVLYSYLSKQGCTVNKLYKALEEIGRPDALDELKAGIRDIEKRYTDSLQKKHRHKDQTENEYMFPSCDDMPYANDGYPSFPQGHHKAMMPPCYNYGMYPRKHQMSGSSGSGKGYQRHKSVDPQCINSRMSGFDHTSPEFKRQRSMPVSESMLVRGRDGHSQYICDVEPMEMASVRDDPVPPALAMIRGMPHYNNMRNIPQLNTTVHPSKDEESMFRQPYGGQYNRQTERAGLKLEIPSPSDMFNRQRSGEFCSPSPTPTTPSTPLGQLHKLANERTFQPEDGYKDLMKMKREEELLQGKMGPNPEGSDKMEFVSQGASLCNSALHSDEQSQAMYSRSRMAPNTFPLRLKSSGSCSSSSSPTNTSQQLTKSASLPSNMKPAEFRKAFRHIKVFVTYSSDDKKHMQRVVSLCSNLKKNGFNCCVDIFHRKLQVEERHGWYQKRFEEADFILVVMSPKYRMEADSCEMENDADDSDSVDSDADNDLDDRPYRLHTKNIYRLMYREYVQCGQRCMRFVPLVFPGVSEDCIPHWMMDANNRLFYFWPKQYKDLLWMLTKPENRVPEHITPPVSRCPQDNGNHMTSDSSETNLDTE